MLMRKALTLSVLEKVQVHAVKIGDKRLLTMLVAGGIVTEDAE